MTLGLASTRLVNVRLIGAEKADEPRPANTFKPRRAI